MGGRGIGKKYQPSGTGGTCSLPAMPHRLKHLTTCLIQNGWQGLKIRQLLLNKFLIKLFLLWEPQKSKMAARGHLNGRQGLERVCTPRFFNAPVNFWSIHFRSKHCFLEKIRWRRKKKKKKEKKKRTSFIVDTNVVASRPPEGRLTGMPHPHAKIPAYWLWELSLNDCNYAPTAKYLMVARGPQNGHGVERCLTLDLLALLSTLDK